MYVYSGNDVATFYESFCRTHVQMLLVLQYLVDYCVTNMKPITKFIVPSLDDVTQFGTNTDERSMAQSEIDFLSRHVKFTYDPSKHATTQNFASFFLQINSKVQCVASNNGVYTITFDGMWIILQQLVDALIVYQKEGYSKKLSAHELQVSTDGNGQKYSASVSFLVLMAPLQPSPPKSSEKNKSNDSSSSSGTVASAAPPPILMLHESRFTSAELHKLVSPASLSTSSDVGAGGLD